MSKDLATELFQKMRELSGASSRKNQDFIEGKITIPNLNIDESEENSEITVSESQNYEFLEPNNLSSKTSRKFRRKQRRPREQQVQSLATVVDEVLVSQGWQKKAKLALVLSKWTEIVGEDIAQHSKVTGFRDSVVYLRTTSTAWAVQLKNLAPQILAKLNKELGDGSVTRINIKGPDAPSWKFGRRSISDGRGPRDTYG